MPSRGTTHTHGSRGLALSASRGRLRTSVSAYDLSPHGGHEACTSLFLYEVERRGLRWVERTEVPRADVALGDIESIGRVELSWRGTASHDAFLSLDGDMLALIVSRSGTVEVSVAGRSGEPVHEAAASIAARLRSDPPAKDELVVLFWTAGPHGAGQATRRQLEAPGWSDIETGYTHAARGEMARLIDLRDPAGGSLLLWHGPPGTGKSHALRALALEWREWCGIHYVTDPEAFLGAGTQYLMSVASYGTYQDPDDDEDESTSGPQWRLIVLEDAGELMAADARASSGQGLSRLLNLTDGLLGQGARCLLLVTTNEPLGRLHPAVRRPGRCLSVVEFGPLAAGEANAWLSSRGSDHVVERPMTLAELYGIAENRPHPEGEASGAGSGSDEFGFARGLTVSP
jgi:hypothetical protein